MGTISEAVGGIATGCVEESQSIDFAAAYPQDVGLSTLIRAFSAARVEGYVCVFASSELFRTLRGAEGIRPHLC